MFIWSLLLLCCLVSFSFAQSDTNSTTDNNAFRRTTKLQESIVCDCGFIDENNQVWTDIWYADFEKYKSSLQYDPHYQLMDYTVSVKHEEQFKRVFKPNNVKKSANGSIALSVKKVTDGEFTSAAFGTKRDDFLYGTYRARMKTTEVKGTVAAFYYYRNSTSEIDMEALSRFSDPHKIYFAIQPQIYENGVASNLTSEKHSLQFNPAEEYHEYRFDWLPKSVKFYVDGVLAREMVTNVPSAPGKILINHWTDGNPNFSGGLPAGDAQLHVSHLNLFFNTSDTTSQLACSKSKKPCQVSDIMNSHILPGSGMGPQQSSGSRINILYSGLVIISILTSFLSL